MFVQFWDMHSGGGIKEPPYSDIYIEADSEDIAKVIFYNRFGHNPDRVTCACCGEDYSISSDESLEQITGFHRNCKYDNNNKKYIEERDRDYKEYLSLEEYSKSPNVKIIYKDEIKEEEKIGEVPRQGYVWI